MRRGLASTLRLVRRRIIGSVRNWRPIRMSKWSAPKANWKSIGSCAFYKPEVKRAGVNIFKKAEGT